MNTMRRFFDRLHVMRILNYIMLLIAILTLAATWNSLEKQTAALKHQSMDLQLNSYVEIRKMYIDMHSSLLTSSYPQKKEGTLHQVAFLTEDLVNILTNASFDEAATSIVTQTIIRSLLSFNSLACEVYQVDIFEALERLGFPRSSEFFAGQTWTPLMTITGDMPPVEQEMNLKKLATCGRRQ